ncbi:hypothetical protein BC826DRAFT_1008906 [Russula brevipes]|nr:hypothetical protein BC826DRAFT_1008906 [Russula brevipes]
MADCFFLCGVSNSFMAVSCALHLVIHLSVTLYCPLLFVTVYSSPPCSLGSVSATATFPYRQMALGAEAYSNARLYYIPGDPSLASLINPTPLHRPSVHPLAPRSDSTPR